MDKLERHGKRWTVDDDIALVRGMFELRNTRKAKHLLSEKLQRTVISLTDRLIRLGFVTIQLGAGGFPVYKKSPVIYLHTNKRRVRATNEHLRVTLTSLGYVPNGEKQFQIPDYVSRYVEK